MFNEQELLERVDNDWDFLAETVDMLATDGRGLMDEIRVAAGAGDAAGVGRAAHTLKGMISNFCAAGPQASALEVERIGKGGDLTGAPAAIKAMEVQLDGLLAALAAFLKKRP